MNDDLRDRLDAVEQAAGVGGGSPSAAVFIGRFSTDLDARYRIVTDPPADDPIDTHATVAIPNVLPSGYRGGVITLDDDDVRELWDTMPEDAREREREIRREQDDPIPPILDAESDTDR